MELLVLGVLIGAGAARRKAVTKAMAKGYLAIAETSTHLRQDFNDAIIEAKADQARDASFASEEALDNEDEIAPRHELEFPDYVLSTPTLTVIDTFRTAGDADDLHAETPLADDRLDEETKDTKTSVLLFKGVAKSFLKIAEITRSAASTMREDLRDAVEEAKYERELAAAKKDEFVVVVEETCVSAVVVEPEPIVIETIVVAPVERNGAAKTSQHKKSVAKSVAVDTPATAKAPRAAPRKQAKPSASPIVAAAADITPLSAPPGL